MQPVAAAPAAAPVASLARQAQFPTEGELKAAPNGRRLSCGGIRRLGTTGSNYEALVCVYDFDNATGVVSQEMLVRRRSFTVSLSSHPDGRPKSSQGFATYTTSFLLSSQLLYAVEPNIGELRRLNDLWQYDLSQPTEAAIAASRYQVSGNAPTPPEPYDRVDCSGLQLTPHGTVWAAQFYERKFGPPATRYNRSAAVVRFPDVVGAGCGFQAEGFPYRNGQVAYFLPNVITNMLYAPPALNYAVGCGEDSVQLWASSAGLPAGLRWDFGEPGSGAANAGRGRQVAHRYARGGRYRVRLTLADGRELAQTIEVPAQADDFTDQNVFTLNGDDLNDAFLPSRQPLPASELRVFSRWGREMYRSADPTTALRWDGSGSAAGDYFYELTYADCQGQRRRRCGVVTLMR